MIAEGMKDWGIHSFLFPTYATEKDMMMIVDATVAGKGKGDCDMKSLWNRRRVVQQQQSGKLMSSISLSWSHVTQGKQCSCS